MATGRICNLVAVESGLKSEALDALNRYLAGSKTGQDVAAWALDFLIDDPFDEDPLLREVLEELTNLDHNDPRWDTPRENLEYLRDCMLGKKEFKAPVVRETHA